MQTSEDRSAPCVSNSLLMAMAEQQDDKLLQFLAWNWPTVPPTHILLAGQLIWPSPASVR